MKKILIAALIPALSALSMSAHAEGGYAGVAVQRSDYSIDISGVTNASSSKPTGFKIYGGYDFTPNLAVEVGYADLGSTKTGFTYSGVSGNVEVSGNSFYVAGKGTMPINEQFSAYGKLGIARNNADATATAGAFSAKQDGSKTDLFAAIGVSYNFTKNVAATLEYDSYGKFEGNSGRLNAWSLGLRVGF